MSGMLSGKHSEIILYMNPNLFEKQMFLYLYPNVFCTDTDIRTSRLQLLRVPFLLVLLLRVPFLLVLLLRVPFLLMLVLRVPALLVVLLRVPLPLVVLVRVPLLSPVNWCRWSCWTRLCI